MAGTLALTKAELSRLMHNKRYFIFTVAFPVILYLLIGRQVTAHAYGIAGPWSVADARKSCQTNHPATNAG